jgi:sigma-B regulation protein RsbU (phosphoserine phosphatase)
VVESRAKSARDQELAVARRVMAELLPRRPPVLAGFDVAGGYETSREVGGDYYEFIPLGDDRWGIAIADVVGKGMAAALLVAAVRASLFALVTQELAQRAILRRANRFFHESVEEGKFVTLFYAVLDVPSRRLIYVNAGHLPPVLLRHDGQVELMEEGGVPLGLFEDPRYREGFAHLNAGDVLVLYTDGITEAADNHGEPYGLGRLTSALQRVRVGSAAAMYDAVVQDVRGYAGTRLQDDQTLVVLKAL